MNTLIKRAFAPVQPTGPIRVDLIRACAVYNKPWATIYMRHENGLYAYKDSIRVRGRVYQLQYAEPEQTYIIDPRAVGEEECAWCGSYDICFHCHSASDGSGCQMMVCRGLSSGNYLRCRCGKEGWAHPHWPKHVGVVIGGR